MSDKTLTRINELQQAINCLSKAERDARRRLRMVFDDLKGAEIQVFAGMFDELGYTSGNLYIRVADCRRYLAVSVLPGAGGYLFSTGDADVPIKTFSDLWVRLRDALAEDIYAAQMAQEQRTAVERQAKALP